MRKFILSMALAIVSVGAYAQVTTGCTPDQNKPEIGATYTYQVNVTGGTAPNNYNGDGIYQWYVTQNEQNLLSGALNGANNEFFSLKGGSAYNSTAATGTENNIKLAWKPDALTQNTPFYLVLKYSEDNPACKSHNVKVMKITPLNNFKVEITPVKDLNGTDFTDPAQAEVCSSDVSSVSIVNNKVKYQYGETKLYYKVTMTGFAGNWKPTIYLPQLQGLASANSDADYMPRKYKSVRWKVGAGGAFTDFATVTDNGQAQTIVAANTTDKNEFILEVTIDNGTYEGLTDEDVQVATKGQMVLANGDLGKRDVDNNCNELTDGNNKKANQKILARPTVTATSGEFIIQIQ
ncbi:hypothetical protein [Capnocytophaga canimorsus]|uniref:hypothetical protein n=1 Tax=Capnocytophaga canimorsus TaxID=28188 RepID=UPI0037D35EB1